MPREERCRLGAKRIIRDGAKSHHFTGLLHILRRELGPARWAAALTACVQGVVDSRKPDTDDGVANWKDLFRELGPEVRAGRVRLATTNFDDMLARDSGLKVISRTGLVFDPFNPATIVPILPTVSLPGQSLAPEESQESKRIVLQLWGNSADQSGRLHRAIWEKAAGVLHLHGWYQRPDDLVVDPVDYHLASERAVGLDLSETLLTNLLLLPTEIVVFVGAGDGMLDDHFVQVWKKTDSRKGESSFDPRTNLWLLNRVRDSHLPGKLQGILDDQVGHGLRVEDILTPVVYGAEDPADVNDNFQLAPLRIRDILTQYLSS